MEPIWESEISRWTADLQALGRARGTIRTRHDHLVRLADWAGDIEPGAVTSGDLLAFLAAYPLWSQSYRRGIIASLRGWSKWGATQGRADIAAALPILSAPRPNPMPCPPDNYQRALDAAKPRERLMLHLAYDAGLRRMEIAKIHSDNLQQDLTGWSLIVTGKGGHTRAVPLTDAIALELRARFVEQGAGYAFPGARDGHLSAEYVGILLARLLPGIWTAHKLRHSFATRAYSVNHDLFAVQQLLGHQNANTTAMYVLVAESDKRRITDAIAS